MFVLDFIHYVLNITCITLVCFARASVFDIQHKVWHPAVVPRNGLESADAVVLQRLLSALLFTGIHAR